MKFLTKFICSESMDKCFPEEACNMANNHPTYFRKTTLVLDEIEEATLYSTALGVYEIRINGEKLGDEYLSPGFTDYAKRVYYQTYDVTNKLIRGENVFGAIVADGWFSGRVLDVGYGQFGNKPYLAVQIVIKFKNGKTEVLRTDESWKTSMGGLVYSDILIGEYYDSNLEPQGWDMKEFDDSNWKPSKTEPICQGSQILPQKGAAVKKMQTQNFHSVDKNINGKYIYDMGQNMVGTVTVSAKAKKREKLVLRFGEMLNMDGTLYTDNLRTALQTDIYVFGSDKEETFTPKFTFHGFRYVESNLELKSIVGNVLYSECKQSGFVETANELVNKLFSNQLWGQRGNFVSIPTDCPQRDERMGWTGDAQIFAKSACYNMNSYEFYMKYLADVRDAQLPNGAITNIAPNIKASTNMYRTGSGAAGWGDAIFVIPYHLYNIYGRKEAIIENYDSMERYFEFLLDTTENYIRPNEGYGDWLSVNEITPKNVLATGYFAYDAYLLSEMAEVLGKTKDALKYKNLFLKIKQAFCKKFVDEDGKIYGDTQCCYLIALKFKLVDDIEKAKKHLIKTIERQDYHICTGFVGVSYMLPILCDLGLSDIAYKLLLNETYPSWGYSIVNGATTIWERWNSYTIENGFADKRMNSFNHYSLGSVAEWMYEYMGGIKPLVPGFKEISIKPFMDERVNEAEVLYSSCVGDIKVYYNLEKGEMKTDIPMGVKAKIYAPKGSKSEKLKGKSVGDYILFKSEGGSHSFVWQNDKAAHNDLYCVGLG